MIIHNHEQGTQEWFDCRKGKMTASNAQAIWNSWKGLETYIKELMSKYYSSWIEESYTNQHIYRWNELEPIARSMYELQEWVIVKQVWFCEYDEYVWCSPDGLVWDDWWVEIKCQDDKKHFWMLLWDWIDSSYIRQIQMNLFVTGRKWRDFVSYNPNYKQSLIIKRITPDAEKIEELKKWFEKGKNLILDIKNKYEARQKNDK